MDTIHNNKILIVSIILFIIFLVIIFSISSALFICNNSTTPENDSDQPISDNNIKLNICLIIIAFGEPEITLKLKTLKKNINKIKKSNCTLDIHLNLYTENPDLVKKILNIDPNIIINQSAGYLLELLFKFNSPDKYVQYDNIIMLLDDVEIKNVNINDMINKQNKYGLDIISPKITNATYDYMEKLDGLRFSTSIEFYMYIFTPMSYQKYFEYLDKNHSTMWGYDRVLYYGMGLKCAIDYNYSCKHLLKLTQGGQKGFKELAEVEARIKIPIHLQTNPLMPLDDNNLHPIIKAYYGTNDITDKIVNLYDSGMRQFLCSNGTFEDRDNGKYKYLIILYKQDGIPNIQIAMEKSMCTLNHHKIEIIIPY